MRTEALCRIGEVYAIEAKIRDKPPHERQRARQAEAKPLLDDLESWLRGMLQNLSRKSDTSAAIMYALNLWPALARYCDDGLIEIDNSAAECALSGVAATVLTSCCPGIAPGSWHLPGNTPLPSGVTPSRRNSTAHTRRR